MIYLLIFFVTTLLFCLAYKNKDKKITFIILSIITIMCPTILAALRSTSIGTDVEVYVVPLFKQALISNSFSDFSNMVSAHDIELFFKLLIYFSTKFFSNINVTLFFIHLPICLLFYVAAMQNKDKAYPPLVYLLFLLTFYNMSLNIMRQFIAVAVIFYAFKNLEKEKYLNYILLVIIASFFHVTAIISIAFPLIYIACKSKRRILYSIILITVLCVGLINYNNLLSLLYNTGIIPYKYITRYSITDYNISVNFADELIRIFPLLLIFFQSKIMKNSKNNIYFTTIAIFDFVLIQVSILVPFAQRICIYFTIFSFINIARIIKNSKINKVPLSFVSILLFTIYFVYSYLYIGIAETYPYILIM